jgi:DNA-binding NtrC family response regulator
MLRKRAVDVLHVDDDPAMLDLTVAFLERLDAEATLRSVMDAEEALEILRTDSESVDVVVSDFSLPDEGGIAFLEAVREVRPDVPFIFFTGRTDTEQRALDHGATDYIVKGNAATLNDLVHRIVEVVDLNDEPACHEAGAAN